MPKPVVAIFNGRLLSSSETFVKAQAEGLSQFVPHYVGARLIEGLPVPPERTLVVNQGGVLGSVAEVLFKQTGISQNFYRQLRQIDPALIHAHFGVCGALALPIAKEIQIPLVVTYHGFDASMTDEYARRNSISTRVYLRRRERLKQEASLFIAVSDFIKGKLVSQGFPSEKIQVHYIGIDVGTFRADPAVERRRQILFVGRLVEKKGCEYLIRAVAAVQSKFPDVELIVIGDGPLKSELEALAAKSLTQYQFLGRQSSKDVKAWMNQCFLLAAPSFTTDDGDSEGLPIVILEALAMGLPVVSTYHAGIPEAVIHEETGLLGPEKDWEALAERIERLLAEPGLWRTLSDRGRDRVLSSFNLHEQITKLEAIYQDVLDKSASR